MHLPALLLALIGSTPAETPRLFRPFARPAVPAEAGARNPVDAFILARLRAKGLTLNRPAEPAALLRRLSFDLTGLPPDGPEPYERAVERLLATPAFGERWAQPWLDLVRFAESDGFNQDALRPDAWRYRDWVIRAFNADLPYRDFVRHQLAGDEAGGEEALTASGFLRLHTDEYNAAQLEQRRQEILDDVTETAGLAFLGLTFGCARCHDHKYDPISQKDYFRLQAFFAALVRRDVPLPSPEWDRWQEQTRAARAELDAMVAKKRKDEAAKGLERFNADIRRAFLLAPEKRTPFEEQIALLAGLQVRGYEDNAPLRLPAAQKKAYQDLEKKLPPRPHRPHIMAVADVAREAPPTHRLIGGDWRKPAAAVQPGFPASIGGTPEIKPTKDGTGRRTALADWLTKDDHPLTARVAVNRIWQQLTGQGIVATPSDFGAQGTPPTHPDLLDWLAKELIESGWSVKHVVRLIVMSDTYRQSSFIDPTAHAKALRVDRENTLLWAMRRRRLEGEAIRDAVLAVSGTLNRRPFGVSARPALPANAGRGGWAADARAEDRDRRSVYVLAKRNMRFPLFDAFDQPDLCQSCGRRLVTTTAPQALALLNGDLTREQAKAWAEGLAKESPSHALETAYTRAWGRQPDAEEMRLGLEYLASMRRKGLTQAEALARICHALFNTSEFSHID